MEIDDEIIIEQELNTFSNDKKNPFKHTIGFINFSYIDKKIIKYFDFDKLGVLVSPYLVLTTPYNLDQDIIDNDSTFFKFFPIKNKELTSNMYQSSIPTFLRMSKKSENYTVCKWNETNFGICTISNSLGEILLDINNCVNTYLNMNSFDNVFIEKDNNIELKLLYLCKKSNKIKGNILYESENKKCIYLIDLLENYFKEDESNNIYLFSTDEIDQMGEGLIITNNFQIIGSFINSTNPVIINKHDFNLDGKYYNEDLIDYKIAILINPFLNVDCTDFFYTKSNLENLLGLKIGSYSYTDYKDIESFFFRNNREQTKDYAEIILSSGTNFIQNNSNISLIGLDIDIIIRQIFKNYFQGEQNQIEKLNFIGNKFQIDYFSTIFSYLYFDSNLIELNLSSIKMDKNIYLQFSYFLYKNNTLKELSLRNINCYFSSLLSIVRALVDNKKNQIQYLDLSYNSFKKDKNFKNDLSFLGQICILQNLNVLRLSNIKNFSEGNTNLIESFLHAVFSNTNESVNFLSKIQVFDISGMYLADEESINLLIDFLLQFGNLDNLILSNCSIDDKSFEKLVNLFKEKEILIKNFDISNNDLTNESQKTIKLLFNTMNELIEFKGGPEVKSDNFSLCLNNNSSLNKNREGDDFGIMFNINGQNFPKKFTLELENTNINKKSLEALFNNIDNFCPSILNLSNNFLKDDDIIESNILSKLGENENFELLILKNNPITEKTLLNYKNSRKNNSILICDFDVKQNNLKEISSKKKDNNNFDYNFVKFFKPKKKKTNIKEQNSIH